MSSQAHLSLVAPAATPPKRKTHNTNRGRKFPPDPVNAEEFALMLQHCVPLRPGREAELSAMRLRVLLVILYRTGLRISEALNLFEHDLKRNDRGIIVRHGKGDKQRFVVVDEWGWREIEFWLTVRSEIAPGALIPVIRGQLAGQRMTSPDVRRQMVKLRERCSMRRRVHPHAFRHGFAVDCSREGIPMYSLQGALGHARLDVTERYLRGIDPMERLAPIAARRAPTTVIPSIRSHAASPGSGLVTPDSR
jgi:site-specific recombinase XerD